MKMVETGHILENEARIFFLQIADAIQYCHHQKLIHRDLKLENILLADKDGRKIKIVDFGIAGLASNFDISRIGAGSLKYMAPELFTRKL
jgi:MAP/microtubule affinity-regulating kinase